MSVADPPKAAVADALLLAGDVAAQLEQFGLVACGRKRDGVTHIDFWTPNGHSYRCPVEGREAASDLLQACLHLAGIEPKPERSIHWS